MQSFKLSKWTNLNVPIHSRGGCFKIIAWTKRRKLLKQNRNTNELQKLTFYFDLSCKNSVEITIRQNSIKSLNFLFFWTNAATAYKRNIWKGNFDEMNYLWAAYTCGKINKHILHMEMWILFWKNYCWLLFSSKII